MYSDVAKKASKMQTDKRRPRNFVSIFQGGLRLFLSTVRVCYESVMKKNL